MGGILVLAGLLAIVIGTSLGGLAMPSTISAVGCFSLVPWITRNRGIPLMKLRSSPLARES